MADPTEQDIRASLEALEPINPSEVDPLLAADAPTSYDAQQTLTYSEALEKTSASPLQKQLAAIKLLTSEALLTPEKRATLMRTAQTISAPHLSAYIFTQLTDHAAEVDTLLVLDSAGSAQSNLGDFAETFVEVLEGNRKLKKRFLKTQANALPRAHAQMMFLLNAHTRDQRSGNLNASIVISFIAIILSGIAFGMSAATAAAAGGICFITTLLALHLSPRHLPKKRAPLLAGTMILGVLLLSFVPHLFALLGYPLWSLEVGSNMTLFGSIGIGIACALFCLLTLKLTDTIRHIRGIYFKKKSGAIDTPEAVDTTTQGGGYGQDMHRERVLQAQAAKTFTSTVIKKQESSRGAQSNEQTSTQELSTKGPRKP